MEMEQTEKEGIRAASAEVSREFKTLINADDLDSLKQSQHLMSMKLRILATYPDAFPGFGVVGTREAHCLEACGRGGQTEVQVGVQEGKILGNKSHTGLYCSRATAALRLHQLNATEFRDTRI